MSKKILIPLIILGVILAAGFGIFIASNQSAQPSAPETEQPKTNELRVGEIERSFTVPADLGDVTYSPDGTTGILFYSTAYEKLDGCAGKPLGGLVFQDTEASQAIQIGGQHKYAKFTPQPQGACGAEDGIAFADTLGYMLANPKN